MNKFYTTAASTETPEIKKALDNLGYTELEPAGANNHLFVDTVNKTYWDCDHDAMDANINMAKANHNETPTQLTLKEVQSWES